MPFKTKKRKIAASIGAVAMAAAILLTGTFAWQSISQQALNETMSAVNPGGRLHDDFDGRNKDVYVENFGDTPIFARVRLDEYMEIGAGAGLKTGDADYGSKKATPVKDGADINDMSTWTTHISGATAEDDPFHEYVEWELGGSTTYMPTFNKNKDSLKADINGTYDGTDPDDDIHYDDYHAYSPGEQVTDDAIYDADDNTVDEDPGVENTNYTKQEEQHTAKATLTATVMTMEEWLDAGSHPGPYWVYDVDGWAYWAQAIEPDTATGLLLNGLALQKEPDDDWYYGINVVGQFASMGDWGDKDSSTGFYEDGITDDALFLLNQAAGRLPEATRITIEGGFKQYVAAGEALTLKANVTVKNPTGAPKETYVEWSCEDAGSALQGNIFTPTEDMEGKTYKITATSALTPEISTYVDVIVLPKEAAGGEGTVEGDLDGKTYIDFGDNTYREIQKGGALGPWKCAGLDKVIGNNDDRTDVVVAEEPTDYGTKFLGPIKMGDGEYYLAAGQDGMVGTDDDIKVVSNSTFPNDLMDFLATGIEITVPSEVTGDSNRVKPGKYYSLSAKGMNGSSPSIIQDVTWSLNGSKAVDKTTTITQDGRLYISGNEPEDTLLTVTVRAENLNGDPLTASVNFTVRDWERSDLKTAPTGTITTVTIDGTEFYLLAKNGDQVLIWAKESVQDSKFGSSVQYEGSTAQSALNTWLNSKTTLRSLAQPYTIYTRQVGTQNFVTSANQKAFLLSEADLFGTQAGAAAQPQDYTYAGKQLLTNDNPVRSQLLSSNTINWLRSLYTVSYVASVHTSGSLGNGSPTYAIGLRPALWINLA